MDSNINFRKTYPRKEGIIGAKQEDNQRRIRYNRELHDDPEVLKIITLRKLQRVDHVQRMEDTRIPKRVFE